MASGRHSGHARRRAPARAALRGLAAAAAALLAAVAAPAAGAAGTPAAPRTLRIMTFNVWYGGDQVAFGQVARAIRAARPDIVGIQEPDGNLRRIASAVGFPYVDERRYLISRFPLFDSGAGVKTGTGRVPYSINGQDPGRLHAWALVGPGAVVAVANTHLTSDPYGPEAVRDGATPAKLRALEEETRVPEVRPLAAALGRLARGGTPVFLTGDFNSPSHLDWTPAAVGLRPALKFPFSWPAAKALADAGLRDSFRAVHPDPVVTPGLTWTPGRPFPYVPPTETQDRIDLVWSGGRAEPQSSEIVGEPGNPAVGIAIDPYPSDHRAVVSAFRVTPATAPALVATDRPTVTAGAPVVVRFTVPNRGNWQVALVPRGAGANRAIVSAGTSAGPGDYADRPSVKLGTLGMRPGEYDALLLDAKGRPLARDRFTVLARGARPRLSIARRTLRPGEPVRVRWANAPGWRNDWVSISKAGTRDVFDYIGYVYTGARVAGSEAITVDDLGRLARGDYVARLLRDDHYDVLAQARFSVR